MRKIFVVLSLITFLLSCNKKRVLELTTLKDSEFNSERFEMNGKIPESRKKDIDSCMGFSFDANAILIRTKDTFFIGNIVNRKSLQGVNSLWSIGFTTEQLMTKFNMRGNLCYETQTLHISLKNILGPTFSVQFPGAGKEVSDELNNDVANAQNTEMRTGQWVYLDLDKVIANVCDTAASDPGLNYKKDLLNPDNMLLAAVEGLINIRFIITVPADISGPLQDLLKHKPSINNETTKSSTQVFYMNSRQFEMEITGFSPIAGQFVSATLK